MIRDSESLNEGAKLKRENLACARLEEKNANLSERPLKGAQIANKESIPNLSEETESQENESSTSQRSSTHKKNKPKVQC